MSLLLCLLSAAAQDPAESVTELDLEDLMRVRVTSAAKKDQAVTDVPAAVHVLREEDLRRAGARSLAEALRAVPGVQVARVKSHQWAVTSRGFNDGLANKLLVLIDGRSVYSPLQSGVYWDTQDTLLQDIERIEVIRGPGGALWGANAVNGVINVITKPAASTTGGLVEAGGGSEDRAFGALRFGSAAGEDLHVRVYGKGFDADDFVDGLDDERDDHDDWWMSRAGLRADWTPGDDRLTLTADAYAGEEQDRVTRPLLPPAPGQPTSAAYRDRTSLEGAHALARWEGASGLTVQAYYDYYARDHAFFGEAVHTWDLDVQHRFTPLEGHDLIWGAGYRVQRIDFDGDFSIRIDPELRRDDIVSAFIQDEIALVEDRLRLTLGAKFEHNDYSGFEVQPSVRLAWLPDEGQTVWLAASRAVRTPSPIDHDGRLTPLVVGDAPSVVFSIFGDRDFRSEELLAYEAGYRVRPAEALTLDLALFYNVYDDLRSGTPGALFLETDPAPAHLVVPINLGNELRAKTWGGEISANLRLASWWLVQANYSHLRVNLSEVTDEGRDPRHQIWLRSAMNLPWDLTLDLIGRHVGALEAFDLDSYTEADVRLAWSAEGLEIALVGQNLLRDSHAEFESPDQRNEVPRAVYASVTWRF